MKSIEDKILAMCLEPQRRHKANAVKLQLGTKHYALGKPVATKPRSWKIRNGTVTNAEDIIFPEYTGTEQTATLVRVWKGRRHVMTFPINVDVAPCISTILPSGSLTITEE